MNAGGAEGFLMKVYRGLDKSKYQMDFCINVREKCFYEDEILAMGGKIYRIPSKSENLKEFKRQLAETVCNNGYDHVIRVTSSAMGFMDLKIAKKAGARVCCARSSNSSDGDGLKAKVAHRLGRLLYRRYVDVRIAPSDLAAKYTFGNAVYARGGVNIVHNGVDLSVFRYDAQARDVIRAELSVPQVTSDGLIRKRIICFCWRYSARFMRLTQTPDWCWSAKVLWRKPYGQRPRNWV